MDNLRLAFVQSKVFLLLLFLLGGTNVSLAQFGGQRQVERKTNRWTISDWFETKKKMSEQNFWLSQHVNKVPIDGAFGVMQNMERLGFSIDFYVRSFGLRIQHQEPVSYLSSEKVIGGTRSQVDGQIRLFGNSIQDTNIVIRAGAGYDQVKDFGLYDASYLGWSIEPEVQIYFAKFLGVWGSWKYRFSHKPANGDAMRLAGTSWKTAAFIEMNALRIEAGYESRIWEFKSTPEATLVDRRQETQGLFGGLRFFY